MENNSLYNINNNKILQDKLSTQMSTTKKLTRPSDDPVTAIRALRLRTSVSELTQCYEKNAPDILKGVSFRVEKGTLFAIVGGNGTGKSTLLKSICGICRPYSGSR